MKVNPTTQTKHLLAVVDTNVLLSAALSAIGAPARLVHHLLVGGKLVFSAASFAELAARIWLPKFDRYITLEQRKAFLIDLSSVAYWVDVPPMIAAQAYSRETDDDKFIHTAVAAQAPWLITGDKDLLVLADAMLPLGLYILSPANFIASPGFLLTKPKAFHDA
jgi:uncharacterized protein